MVRYMILSILVALSSAMSLAQKDVTWLRQWGGSGTAYQEDWARDIAVDDSGNVYVTGICNAGGVGGGYVTLKYSRVGKLRWERIYYGATYNESHAIAIDTAHNVWVTGESGASATRDIYTVAYDPDGNLIWGRRFDFGGGTDVGEAIDAFDADHVAVTGYSSNGGAPVLFHGANEWSRQVPGLWGQAIDVTNSRITVGGVDSPGFGIAQFDFDGNLLWHTKTGAPVGGYSLRVPSLVVDSAGNSYVTGTTGDAYTVSLDNTGNVRWSTLYSGQRRDSWSCLALDSKVNVVTGGYTDQGTGASYEYRCMVAKSDSQGNALWSKVLDFGGVTEVLAAIAIGRGDTIYVAGERYASHSGDADYLIAKLSPEGEVVWWTTYAGNGNSYSTASAVAVDASGGLYVTGWSSQNNEWPDNADIVTIKFWGRDTFRPDRDGWQFGNTEANMWPQSWWSQFDYTKPPYPFFLSWPPIKATSADFPDWPLFVDVFGIEQCYKNAGNGSYYFVPTALLRWRTMVETMRSRDNKGNITHYWRGSCSGFALSALLYYNDLLSLKWTLGSFDNVYSVPISDESRYLINKYFTAYLGNFDATGFPTGVQVFNTLKAMLVDNYTNDQFVTFQDLVTGAAHAVVACSLAAIGSGWWELPIYDPNYPGAYMHLNYSELTKEWSVEELSWHDVLLDPIPIVRSSQTPILPAPACELPTPGAPSDSSVSVFNSPYADIRIRNGAGETIGFAGGARIDSMPGARARFDFSETEQPPGGYFLPPGDYTASIGMSLDSTTYFTIFLDSAAFSFHREGAGSGDNEVIRFSTTGGNLTVVNLDAWSKPFFVQTIEKTPLEETVCRVHVSAMPGGDSLGIGFAGERCVSLVADSQGMTADLWLELVKDYANPLFRHEGLVLEGGAAYLLAPDWDSLASVPLLVYVDRDRDGVADDTLRLENQGTEVPPGRGDRVPEHFELGQNYPNPFNPTTKIQFTIVNRQLTTLNVFDLLGREIAAIVNEVKEPGTYTVEFDGSNLASGVYFYRLTAGNFVETRKMVLVR